MIMRNIFTSPQRTEQAHEGQGHIHVSRPMLSSDFVGPWHFVEYAVLVPGTSIGLHRHGQDEELYFILEGEGVMTVNSEQRRVSKGDLILNPPGGAHSLVNDSERDVHLLVIEVGLTTQVNNP